MGEPGLDVLVVGTWTPAGAPDPDTAGLLVAVSHLGARLHGADLGARLDDPAAATAVAEEARRRGAAAVVLAAGTLAEDLVPRVAALLDGVAALDCTALDGTADGGALTVRRAIHGGALEAELEVPPTVPLVASLAVEPCGGDTPPLVGDPVALDCPSGPVRVVRTAAADTEVPLARARRIVAGGRGIGGPEGFAVLERLAAALDARLAASRPPCDAGWVPGRHQVGITGARVSPEVYLAVGISGSVQHRAGMRSSRTVAAVNDDPDAPILQHADLAVVGDWREVVAGMLEELCGDAPATGSRP